VLHDRPLLVSGEEGLKALAIAVAAENSHRHGSHCSVKLD
jgi:hypothetical protein